MAGALGGPGGPGRPQAAPLAHAASAEHLPAPGAGAGAAQCSARGPRPGGGQRRQSAAALTPRAPGPQAPAPRQGTRSAVLGWGAAAGGRLGLQEAAGGPAGAVHQAPMGTQGVAGQSAPPPGDTLSVAPEVSGSGPPAGPAAGQAAPADALTSLGARPLQTGQLRH